MNWFSDWLFGNSDTRTIYRHRKKLYNDIDKDLKEIARTRKSQFPFGKVTIIKKYNTDIPTYFRVYFFCGNRGYVLSPNAWGLSCEIHPLFGGYTSGRYWRKTFVENPHISDDMAREIRLMIDEILTFEKSEIERGKDSEVTIKIKENDDFSL